MAASVDSSLAAPAAHLSKSGASSSAASIASSDGASPVHYSTGDGALDKFKGAASDDARSETSSHRRNMSRLFKGRRRRRKSSGPADSSSAPADARDEAPPVPPLRSSSHSSAAPVFHQSEESLGLHKSESSSLLVDDSDPDAPSPPARPGLSPRQSHAGYLTLSSPLIASETVDNSAAPSHRDTTLADSTASAHDPPPAAPPADSIDVPAASNKRASSPVGKLKEAFNPTARRSTSPKKTAGSGDSSRPGTSGGGGALGSLFGGKRRGDKVLLDDSGPLSQASPPLPPPLPAGRETQSTPSLPSTRTPVRILTQTPATPPNAVDAPTTLVTPPTPTDAKPASPTASAASPKGGAKHVPSQSNPNVVVSPSGNMISHRRARSATNPPSKLSNSITAPLTPTLEEAKTPGGTAVPPPTPSGFFSSVFSAAQNAANTLSTTITNNTATNKSKVHSQHLSVEDKNVGAAGGEEVIGHDHAEPADGPGTAKRELAVETLGSGNLSLAQLGIIDSSDPSPMSSATNLPMKTDEASARAEDMAATQAVSAAYALENPPATSDRPLSVSGTPGASAVSPPRQPEATDSPAASSLQRQGSIRSRISGGRKRRHRGSSATTGNTIAAAVGASTSTLLPQASLNGRPNGTGFAVASSKRNRDFHSLFKSVPDDDYLIEDYSAALQKEILLHGRLYVSEGHLCFSSNILGWVTNLVISFDEVVSVEKKSTAVLFPNAIVIQTLHARNIFASFLSRDSTYDLIIGIWKISHPNLKSSLNGVALDGSAGTGDKTEKAESIGSEDGSIQDSDDEVYDEDAEEDEGLGSFTEADGASMAGSEQGSVNGDTRKASAAIAQAVSGGPVKLGENGEVAAKGDSATPDFPGLPGHAPTECGDSDQHYDKLLIDTTIPAPLGKIYSLMFGPASGVFMRKWLLEDQKSTDLQMEDDKKGLGEELKSFSYSYIKPLPGSIGPRQTKCNIGMSLEQFNLEKAITVLCSTQTPDVPSGNIFVTKTRYCLMWGPNNSTRLIMTFTVEWSGKSWLKGPIEKGANDGQMSYATSLSTALRAAVTKSTLSKAPGKPGRGKKRSKVPLADEALPTQITNAQQAAAPKQKNWGILEPLRTLLGPVAEIIDALLTTQFFTLFLFTILMYSWFFRAPLHPGAMLPGHSMTAAQRQIAYEEIWRHEESELWKWLEERVAMDRVHAAVVAGKDARDQGDDTIAPPQNMQQREVDEAIRITEQHLEVLKARVNREREKGI